MKILDPVPTKVQHSRVIYEMEFNDETLKPGVYSASIEDVYVSEDQRMHIKLFVDPKSRRETQ